MDRDDRDRLARLSVRFREFANTCAELWLAHAPDPKGGGVHGFLDREFHPVIDPEGTSLGPSGERRGEKGLIQQSRHLWAWSTWYERREQSKRVRDLADSVYRLLRSRFYDASDREFFLGISPEGVPLPKRKQIYALSFAVYGLSTYGRVFGAHEATELALDCFLSFDGRAHDASFGGYVQTDDGDWLRHVDAPSTAEKCTNTHIHVMEALTALSRASGDPLVEDRLKELVRVIGTRMLQPSGYVHKHFTRSFEPVGLPVVSYGHDLETAWLLVDAAERLDDKTRNIAEEAARRMAEHADSTGFDAARGGYFDYGVPLGASEPPRVVGREKLWWVQAESLAGLFWLYRFTGKSDLVGRMEQTFEYMLAHLVDPRAGELFWGVLDVPEGGRAKVGPRGDHKGELWKTPYHAQRALVFTSDWIDELLA